MVNKLNTLKKIIIALAFLMLSVSVVAALPEATDSGVNDTLVGDLNDNGVSADAGDLVLMKRASVGEIQADLRYDLNNNGKLADAGDLVLMKRASIGEIGLNLPGLSFDVDTKLMPQVKELPGFEKGTNRPLASVIDAHGNKADFVENELWLSTDDALVLKEFLVRWNGEAISTFDPKKYGLSNMSKQYLIRVDVSSADVSNLVRDSLKLDPYSKGTHRVSTEKALKLLAAGANEAANGLQVGINFVGQGDTFRDHNSFEAPLMDTGEASEPNVFNWPSFNAGSILDIGVTEAWRVLELAGKLNNKVDIAILDMGFSPSSLGPDLPADWVAISNVPFTDAIGTTNLIGCGGGNPCPWHGTNVVSAAFAVPDNGYGSAGPAGPIAKPILVFTLYDFFTSITALGEAKLLGADIASMSYHTRVPATLSWAVIPFDIATIAFRSSGMILFAAAGNDGENVDAQDCFIFCWEEAWYTPCENNGVECVGGIRDDSNRDSKSNYGPEEVDIFAPFTLMVGPDPSNGGGNIKKSISGTSFSSPYAAGVAGLIWAANPGLSSNEVMSILHRTAHTSLDHTVNRYVNAKDAVLEAIGNSAPPYIKILNPHDGASSLTRSIRFYADAEDLEDGFVHTVVSWTSDRDGPIGTGANIRQSLSFGTHTITATAVDSDGNSNSDSVTISVINSPPTVTIQSVVPSITPCASFACSYRGQTIIMSGTSFDPNEEEELPVGQVGWYLDGSITPFGTGHTANIGGDTLSVGTHTITFKGTDGVFTAMDSVTISVLDNPAGNIPPTAYVYSPENGTHYTIDSTDAVTGQYYKEMGVCGEGDDPEDGTLAGVWYARKNGGIWYPLRAGTGSRYLCPSIKFYLDEDPTKYDIKLRVQDSAGQVAEDEVTIFIRSFG